MLFPIRISNASVANKGQDHTKILNERQKLLPRMNGRSNDVATYASFKNLNVDVRSIAAILSSRRFGKHN